MIRDTISEEIESFDQDDSSPSEAQPPLSPATGAESLFLAGLATSQISADALSTKLRHAHRYSSGLSLDKRSISGASVRSVLTDDFQSCAEFSDDLDFPADDDTDVNFDDNDSAFFSFFRTPPKTPTTATMARSKTSPTATSTLTSPSTSTSSVSPPPPSAPPAKEGMDVADNVYERAKGIWAWGKGAPILSIGFGITEAVVGKAVSMAGTDFAGLDKQIKPQLGKLDHDVINPAIEKVIGIVLGAAGKTESILKPIVIKVLSPFGLIKNEAENPELTK